MSNVFDHDVIITRISRSLDDPNEHLTTKNVAPLRSCCLCWRHAEHEYHTTPFFMTGTYYPSETRHLCTMHYRQVWQVMLESLYARVRLQEEVA